VAANSISERVLGKPCKQAQEEHREPQIDLSQLTGEELKLLTELVASGRLQSVPNAVKESETEIEGAVQVVDGVHDEQ